MSKKTYKEAIIAAGVFPTPAMVKAVEAKHMATLNADLVLGIFKQFGMDKSKKQKTPSADGQPDAAKKAVNAW